MILPDTFSLPALSAAYHAGLSPVVTAQAVLERVSAAGDNPVWITRVPDAALLERARMLADDPAARSLPLYGVPFAVKDNIDAAGLPTTAGCPEFTYQPERNATVVQRLLDAGAMLVGKTNLDQFATGLVGTRSPYGEVRNAFHSAYVSGGSSSGSAVAVALGQVGFALGTDTAGSGRVPAAFNNLVGLKPSRGRIPTRGVVPACRTLDCVSIFALDCDDARRVLEVAEGFDPLDPWSRPAADQAPAGTALRIGVPRAEDLEWFGDTESAELFARAAGRLERIGAVPVAVDWLPLREAAELLYGGPWVAERHAAIRGFVDAHPGALLPVIRDIIGGAARFSATDAFEAQYRLAELTARAAPMWRHIDALLLPTTPNFPTREQVTAEPVAANARLGIYTNFVNLLDLAAIAVPAGRRAQGLPFGVTFIAPADSDRWLCALGARWQALWGAEAGATGKALPAASPAPSGSDAPDGAGTRRVRIAVVGAHLSGQPLNRELTERGARLLRAARTAPNYRLYALDTVPAKPGLVRAVDGGAIELEVWELDERAFGSFVAAVTEPMVIGTVTLEDGSRVKGFLCEPIAIEGAADISKFGGWRAWLASKTKAA